MRAVKLDCRDSPFKCCKNLIFNSGTVPVVVSPFLFNSIINWGSTNLSIDPKINKTLIN